MPLPSHVSDFVDRWTEKREAYKEKTLNDCFDRFFTSFVIYNFLYGWLSQPESYSKWSDREKATKIPKKYLGADILYKNKELQAAAKQIAGFIAENQFTLKNSDADKKTLEKLKSTNKEQWCVGLMEAVYQVRCNTFHGSKGFEDRQQDLLNPCTLIVEIVSDLIIERQSQQQEGE